MGLRVAKFVVKQLEAANHVVELFGNDDFSFLRAKAATALARLSRRNSVCLSVRHTGGSVNNGASQDHQILPIGCLKDSSFRNRKVFP